jgi:hypothetical protein
MAMHYDRAARDTRSEHEPSTEEFDVEKDYEEEEEESGEKDSDEAPAVDRDWRALIVACVGLGVIALVAIWGFSSVPDSIQPKQESTKGENVVAIAAAAFTAVATALAAYFGIKAANLAREETAAAAEERSVAAEREGIRTAQLAGAPPDQLGKANREATEQIKALGLGKAARRKNR